MMNKKEMKSLILKIDSMDYYENDVKEDENINIIFNEFVKSNIAFDKKGILGIDIYKYSQYPIEKQTLIPIIFDLIFDETIRWCQRDEKVFFNDFSFEKNLFIHTGDGGFQIFDNPIQALVFNINFNTIIRLFNSGHFYPKLRQYIKEIVFRTCITYDKVYEYNDNYFGVGIITNARILSKDKLNRFLIDENTYDWFMKHINGIESITIMDIDTIFNKFFKTPLTVFNSAIFLNRENSNSTDYCSIIASSFIKDCHIQKIGEIKIKDIPISIYNVEIQRVVGVSDENDSNKKIQFIVSIGSLNVTGIND